MKVKSSLTLVGTALTGTLAYRSSQLAAELRTATIEGGGLQT